MKIQKKEFRFSLTNHCNFRCPFCHHEGFHEIHQELLNNEDYQYLYQTGKSYFGMNKVTITGGEPLLREDVISICKTLKNSGAIVTLVTNAFLLKQKIEIGAYLNQMNLSFHAANPEYFGYAIGLPEKKDYFLRIREGISLFLQQFPNVKLCLNVTLQKSIHADRRQIIDLLNYANNLKVKIKFIEIYPAQAADFYSAEEVVKVLIEQGGKAIDNQIRKKEFSYRDIAVRITKCVCAEASMHAQSSAICSQINNYFISPNGRITICREQNRELDILNSIKSRKTETLVKNIIQATESFGKGCPYDV